jgi:NADPH:quinone reductase-like Zn-dependent oxidoreductase
MKTAVYTHYGSPDVLQIKEVEKPTPRNNEILVKVYASTVSATDSHFRRADPFITRSMNGLIRPNGRPGGLLAGEVEAIGKEVTLFKVGDRVFGSTMSGANAEYICLPEDGVLATIPANLTDEEIVGVPEALTPLYFLRELAKVQRGQKVLINGASGSIGTFAVQLAKHFGAEVTGVCSNVNLDLVKSLGADTVIDYTRADFTKSSQIYDIIFDAVGKSTFSHCKSALKDVGIYLTTTPSLAIFRQMLWTSKFGSKKAVLGFAGLNFHKDDLVFLKELVEAGTIKSVNDRCYPLEQIVEAHRYVDSGRKKGNVVITVTHSDNALVEEPFTRSGATS